MRVLIPASRFEKNVGNPESSCYFGHFHLPSGSAGSIKLLRPSIDSHGKPNLLPYCAVEPCLWNCGVGVAGEVYAALRNPYVSVARELPGDSSTWHRGHSRIPVGGRETVRAGLVASYRIRLIFYSGPIA